MVNYVDDDPMIGNWLGIMMRWLGTMARFILLVKSPSSSTPTAIRIRGLTKTGHYRVKELLARAHQVSRLLAHTYMVSLKDEDAKGTIKLINFGFSAGSSDLGTPWGSEESFEIDGLYLEEGFPLTYSGHEHSCVLAEFHPAPENLALFGTSISSKAPVTYQNVRISGRSCVLGTSGVLYHNPLAGARQALKKRKFSSI